MTEIDETRRRNLGAAKRGTLVPPYNVEAEESLLGAALLSADALGVAVETLRPDDFYKPANRQVFEAMLVLWGDAAPVDPMTVADVLNRFGYLDNIGGLPALLSLEGRTPATTNAARYARIVQDHATLRNLQTLAGEIVDEVAELPTDIEPVISRIRGKLEEISLPGGRADPGPSIMDFIYDESAEEDDWIVPDFLERSDRLILTGPEGRGKSTMIRQLGVQVAAGIEPFSFGRPITPMRVMLVDAENPSPVLRRELRKLYIAAGSNLDQPDRFTVLSRPEGLDLLHRGDRQWLLERLQANAPDVVMIGPLYKFHREDPNDEQAARSLSAFLDDVRIRYRFSLILEAHQPQTTSGRARLIRPVGSSLWLRWPEMGVALVPDGDEETARVWKLKEWRGLRSSRALPQRLIRGGSWPWMTGESADQQAF